MAETSKKPARKTSARKRSDQANGGVAVAEPAPAAEDICDAAPRPIPPDEIFSVGRIRIDRLPMLESLLEEFRLRFCKGMETLTTAQVISTFKGLETGRSKDVMEGFGTDAMIAYAHAAGWNCNIAIRLEQPLINALIESAMGSDRTKPAKEEHPPLSRIGGRVVTAMAEKIVEALGSVMEPLSDPKLRLSKLERRRDAAAMGSEKAVVLVLAYKIESLYRGGTMHLIVPQAPFLPLQSRLARLPSTMRQAPDTDWSDRISARVQGAAVRLDAILDRKAMTLQEVAGFRVGQMIELTASPQGPVSVECSGRQLFSCALGQADGAFTLKVEERVIGENRMAETLGLAAMSGGKGSR